MDLKQIAERLTKCNHVESASGACKICHAGKEAIEVSSLAKDWLAERDPTQLTANVLNEFGARWLPSSHGILTATFDCDNGGVMRVAKWRATDRDWVVTNYNTPISTVGELRTLARLAGVELKGGK